MEIWPTSFKTYNLLVPNLLNLPVNLFRKKTIKKMMGLAMYQSSLSAGCNYCTAHSCSYLLRRGVDESVILGKLDAKESAVVRFSRKMGKIPCTITREDFQLLEDHCSIEEIEAVSMGIVLMGFLNKFMDVIGIELEQNSINDVYNVLKKTEWKVGKHFNGESVNTRSGKPLEKDNLFTYIKVLRQAPGAIRLEKQWLNETPKESKKINEFLQSSIGHDFPFLEKVKRVKLKRVLVTVIRDNFTEKTTKIGLRIKALCGFVFFTIIENTYLQNEILVLSENNEIDISTEMQTIVREFYNSSDDQYWSDSSQILLSMEEMTAIKFTKHASKSPAYMDDSIVEEVTNQFTSESIVELVTWLSVLQALHRLEKLPI